MLPTELKSTVDDMVPLLTLWFERVELGICPRFQRTSESPQPGQETFAVWNILVLESAAYMTEENADIAQRRQSRELTIHEQVYSVALSRCCKNDTSIPNKGRFTTGARIT